jgi:predicted RNA binding protein YcfA (HicA-like mRNA interferase family)
MPDRELVSQLTKQGYTGYKWVRPDGGPTEYFVLSSALRGLRYESLTRNDEDKTMISMAKLEGMLNAEIAADTWWKGLTRKDQEAYIKAHPKSKYAKHGVTKKSAQDLHHEEKQHHHADMAQKHLDAAIKAGKKNPGLNQAHTVAYKAHDGARLMHEQARRYRGADASAEADAQSKKAEGATNAVTSRPAPSKGAIHSGASAVSASNYLVKKFGARRHANYNSNKYSDIQSLDHDMSAAGAKQMHKHLLDNGWKHEESPAKEYYAKKEAVVGTHRRYEHPDGGHIDYTHKLGAHTNSGKDYHHVTVWGTKKAKPTTIPYYD